MRPRTALALPFVVVLAVLLVAFSGGSGGGSSDPLAYSPAREQTLVAAATAGLSHVIYEKTPGGALASVARVKRYASLARQTSAADAQTLEGIVLLESAGRPDAIAGPDPGYASGLTQIEPSTATQLLGMHVDLARSKKLTGAQRRKVDDRFVPRLALAGTERYLQIAGTVFGRGDLAVESYHMGIGNLEHALRLYTGDSGTPIKQLVANDDISYAKLYFDSTPTSHAAAYAWLASLGDDSSTYLWRVLAAEQILRSDPATIARTQRLEESGPGAVLRPPGTSLFATQAQLQAAEANGTLVSVGAAQGVAPQGTIYLRPIARTVLRYIGEGVQQIAKTKASLQLNAGAIDSQDAGGIADASGGSIYYDPLAASGYTFDIDRGYASAQQAQAFQQMLDRLAALDIINWVRGPAAIHVVVGPSASLLL